MPEEISLYVWESNFGQCVTADTQTKWAVTNLDPHAVLFTFAMPARCEAIVRLFAENTGGAEGVGSCVPLRAGQS